MKWYRSKDIRCELFGVFEGGGAKGVAFAGALRALADKGWWFHSVGGASAGAITAALVASGISPAEIGPVTDEILNRLKANSGLWRLATKGEYFAGEEVRIWIREKLFDLTGIENPSFKELRDQTGIHLDVVATNISTQSVIVFSADDTPNCSVVDAVASSAAIPFAFQDRVLILPHNNRLWSHAIVDGGVWANFPFFLYTDDCFRHYYKRDPRSIPSDRVVGFILDDATPISSEPHPIETLPSELHRSASARFDVRQDNYKTYDPEALTPVWGTEPLEHLIPPEMWEHRPHANQKHDGNAKPHARLSYTLNRLVCGILEFLGDLMSGRHEGGVGFLGNLRCPKSRSEATQELMEFLNASLSAIASPFYGGVSIVLIAGSVSYGLYTVWTQTIAMFLADSELTSWLWLSALVLLAALSIVTTVVLFVVISLAIAAHLLQSPVRRVLFGLVSTYVNSSGAPEWYREHPAIVFLPVGGIGTVQFDLADDVRSQVESHATAVTLEWIKKRL